MGLHSLGFFTFFLPSGSNGFPLSEELDGSFTVEVACSHETVLVTCEGEHGERNGDGKINTDLTSFDFVLELSYGVSIS